MSNRTLGDRKLNILIRTKGQFSLRERYIQAYDVNKHKKHETSHDYKYTSVNYITLMISTLKPIIDNSFCKIFKQ